MCYLLSGLLKHQVYLLDSSWATIIKYGDKWSYPLIDKYLPDYDYVNPISFSEFQDSNFDLAIMPCYEQQADFIEWIAKPHSKRMKLASYYGNQWILGAYDFSIFRNHLSADIKSGEEARQHGCNVLDIKPPLDYIKYPFSFNTDTETPWIGTYINYYRDSWHQSYPIYDAVRGMYPSIEWRHYGKRSANGDLDELDIPKVMQTSIASISIKEKEGYGIANLESAALGRPLIALRSIIKTQRQQEWINEDTSILFDGFEELKTKMDLYLTNKEYRMNLQATCSNNIRSIVDPGEQACNMARFLENLI
jgi:hypothetical protein